MARQGTLEEEEEEEEGEAGQTRTHGSTLEATRADLVSSKDAALVSSRVASWIPCGEAWEADKPAAVATSRIKWIPGSAPATLATRAVVDKPADAVGSRAALMILCGRA